MVQNSELHRIINELYRPGATVGDGGTAAILAEEFFKKMQEFLPSTKEEYIKSVKEYGEILETVVIEDIFMPPILKLLNENKEHQLLENIFTYFEEIIDSGDTHLINILSITVLEILGNDRMILKKAKQYMGTKTVALQLKADEELGRV